MELYREDELVCENPTATQIREVVSMLGQPGSEFVILSVEDEVYIQSSANREGECDLEYRDGSDDEHYRCASESLTVADVTAAFQAYAAGDRNWRSRFQWERPGEAEGEDDSQTQAGRTGCLSVIVLGVLAASAGWALAR